jgi:hypothetical protein
MFLPMTRSMRLRIEATIEQLVALLDEIDGDADFEPHVDDENGGDDEPSLGSPNNLHQGMWGVAGYSRDDDLEDDALDLPA